MTGLCHLLLIASVTATPPERRQGVPPVCRLIVDAAQMALSAELRVTVSVEGPSPVEVEVPRPITTSPDWRVNPLPPKTTALPGGWERWEQTFRLEPFQVG